MGIINWILGILGPFIGYFIIRFIKNRKSIMKTVVIVSLLFIICFGSFYVCGIFFKNSSANDIFFLFTYLGIVTIFWSSFHIKHYLLKIPVGVLFSLPVFSSFFLCITGFWGLIYHEYFSSEFKYDIKYNIDKRYSMQITKLGNALEPEGLKIQVFKEFDIIPLMKRINTYTNYGYYGNLKDISYAINEDKIYLIGQNEKGEKNFEKEIKLNSN